MRRFWRRRTETQDPRVVMAVLRNLPGVKPRRSLILCTDERTGSHFLAELLAATGRLGRAYEYFNTEWMQTHYADYPVERLGQLDWAMRLGTTANGVFSVKLHPWTMDVLAGVIDITRVWPMPCFVHLTRTDLLGQAISLHKAEQTRAYTSWSEPQAQPTYDGNRLRRLVHELALRRERWEMYFARNGITPLRLTYEDIVTEPKATVRAVARHVGVGLAARRTRVPWFRFDRHADTVNTEWRQKFISEYKDTALLDKLD